MTTDFRALCVDLLEEITSLVEQNSSGDVYQNDNLIHLNLSRLALIALIVRRASNALPTPTVQNEAPPNDN